MSHAVIQGGAVVNVIIWDGVAEWVPPQGCQAVACSDTVGIGWTYDGENFTAPVADPA